ncbi:MAG TPA: 4-hydroxybenzoate octaprenyltransferase [Steroidobacteraceae bacterium]|jgi:4-hydroxybenzoate polyprenyltransferase|nr:4-hydroxybenzoate octaprenyltransferase [Steroidobacteraceae bacterium]
MHAWDEVAPMEAPVRHRLARRLEEYLRLMRLDRPIGIWLLLWPTLWALWVAGNGRPDPKVLLVFVLGVTVMRSAGCIVNDFADRNVDPHVRRTRARPLAARRVTSSEALVLFLLLLGAALWLVTRLDPFTLRLACVGAALTVSYPFLKRFFALPQLYLALAFSWGVPMAFAALLGTLPRVAWVMFVATILWVTIYDTLYAMVDREDDLKIGVNSSAIVFADMDRLIVGALQLTMLLALLLMGRSLNFGYAYLGALGAVAVFFGYQQWLIRTRESEACLRAFLNNHYVGMAIFIGILLEYIYRAP